MQANGSHVDLYLFGVIGDWWDGNTANDVLAQLQDAKDVSTIDVYISSVGGYFSDGIPIFNLLKMHPATVTVNIIGYCLSMASHIMLAADKVRIAQNGQIMIHNAQGLAYGDYRDMRKAADMLLTHNASIIPEYQRRLKLDSTAIQSLLDAETWYTADQALAAGLVDEIIDPVDPDKVDANQTKNAWQFAAQNFKNPPDAFTNRLQAAATKESWVLSILNKVVGNPPPALEPPSLQDDIEMTPEELETRLKKEREATIAEFNKVLEDKLTNQKLVESDELVTLREQLANAQKQLEAANKELAELKEEVPGTVPPKNTGPADTSSMYDI